MNVQDCGVIRELIPEFAGDRLGTREGASVEDHLAACEECLREFDLVRILLEGRTESPEAWIREVVARVADDQRRYGRGRLAAHRPWWGISAAAVAVIALGIGIESVGSASADVVLPGFAYEAEESDLWLSGDGLVAGTPALDELSDEALTELLEEMVTGSLGGST